LRALPYLAIDAGARILHQRFLDCPGVALYLLYFFQELLRKVRGASLLKGA
jgi:hypothetical protein